MSKTRAEKFIFAGAFGWLVRFEYSDSWMDFKAYEMCAEDDDGTRLFHRRGAINGMDMTSNPDEGEVLSGFVKWDGCCEINFMEHNEGRPHFCHRRDVKSLGDILLAVYDLAAEIWPGFEGNR